VLCRAAAAIRSDVVADHGLMYVSVRGDGKAVDQRISWTASLPPVLVEPNLYCYFSVAVKRNNTENPFIQFSGSLQIC
jgi:hypothetical protein